MSVATTTTARPVRVEYRACDYLPPGIPAAVVAGHGTVVVLVSDDLTATQVCNALTPLINDHARACWTPDERIA